MLGMYGRRIAAGAAAGLASSHLITTCATLAAITIFVSTGSELMPSALSGADDFNPVMSAAFILNIVIILFGWRRANDLRQALEAHARAEKLAHENAYRDHTTGLANRRELTRVLEQGASATGDPRALLLLDLDHFKKVNDLNGHAAGDELLRHMADSLARIAPAGSCYARLGGDEFAVLLPHGATVEAADEVASAILISADRQVKFSGFTANTSASIGMCLVPAGTAAEDALRRGDIAMYVAKRTGRNRAVWFDQDMERQLQTRVVLENEIRVGIERGEFVPFYQPQISLMSGDLTGFEVLARWNSPTRGLVEPIDFIGVAEATGLIAPLSMSVMRQALLETRTWPAHLQIAVNVSPVQFRDPLLAERILKLLTETNFPAARLELEITESSIFEDQEQALATVQSLKNTGISISLDDFGTGYASLTQLQALPFDRIKIDKSFVSTLLVNTQSNAIVSSIAALGKSLSLPITAEGVESDNVRDELQSLGCSNAQGWLFGRAVPADQVRRYLGMDEPVDVPAVTSEAATVVERRDHKRRPSRRRSAG
ncbi:MAG: EAL domain-containing protein [Sphingomicrobium sp.]